MCQNKLRNARILLKKNFKVIFRLAPVSTGLSLRFFAKMKKKKICQQHPVFPGGHPSKYYRGANLVDFGDQTRTGIFKLLWPMATIDAKLRYHILLYRYIIFQKYFERVRYSFFRARNISPFFSLYDDN